VEDTIVYVNDDQLVKIVAHAYKCGLSESGFNRFLQDRGIAKPSAIPLGKAGLLWNALKALEVIAQYR
jgi:hypothetical protein